MFNNKLDRTALILLVFLLTISCKSSEIADKKIIMNSIERAIKLPSKNRNIDDYARFYTLGKGGLVEAVYIVPAVESVKVICSQSSNAEVCTPEMRTIWMLEPGKRMWLEDFNLVPIMDDGGCDYIEMRYDLDSRKIIDLRCNMQ